MRTFEENRSERVNGVVGKFRGILSACAMATMVASTTPGMAAPNTPPTASDFSAALNEDTHVLPFSPVPSGFYNDVDGHQLSAIKIEAIPSHGRFELYDLVNQQLIRTLQVGDTVDVSMVEGIVYIPDNNHEAGDAFQVSVFDGYSFSSAPATITLNITPVNDAPTGITLTSVHIDENQSAGSTVGFLSADDVDAVDSHTWTMVSGTGDADNGEFTITGNKLAANSSFNYEVKNLYTIRLKVEDAAGEIAEVPMTINVNNLNDKPVITAIIAENASSGVALSFSSGRFAGVFADEDNDALSRIQITTLPAFGTLALAGMQVLAGDEIWAADLGNLTYETAANERGFVSFDYKAFDGTDYTVIEGKVEIKVRIPRPSVPLTAVDINAAPWGGTSTPRTGGTPTGTTLGSFTGGTGGVRPGGPISGGSIGTAHSKTAGGETLASIGGIENPVEFMVHNNYPNPFSGQTAIRYELPGDYMVVIKVYNELGAEIATLADGIQNAGIQTITWNAAADLANGHYYYTMFVNDLNGSQVSVKTGTMVKMK